jgi:hypothetical protein
MASLAALRIWVSLPSCVALLVLSVHCPSGCCKEFYSAVKCLVKGCFESEIQKSSEVRKMLRIVEVLKKTWHILASASKCLLAIYGILWNDMDSIS